MLCHIGLQAITTEISSYTICQSYWKMYHSQSGHECGTCMMVLRAVRDVLSNTYHNRCIGRGGPTAWPPRSPDLNPPVGTPESLMYAAPVDNGGALHHRAVDASQSIRNCPSIFVRMRRSMMRRVEACIKSHEYNLSTYYKYTPSAVTHKLNVSGHVWIGRVFSFLPSCLKFVGIIYVILCSIQSRTNIGAFKIVVCGLLTLFSGIFRHK
jgi:hypothetical protein